MNWFLCCICSSDSDGRGKYVSASAAVSACGRAFGIRGSENICGTAAVVLGADTAAVAAAAPRDFFPGLMCTVVAALQAGGNTPGTPSYHTDNSNMTINLQFKLQINHSFIHEPKNTVFPVQVTSHSSILAVRASEHNFSTHHHHPVKQQNCSSELHCSSIPQQVFYGREMPQH